MAEHVGHGEGLAMFVGRVPGCPACESMPRLMPRPTPSICPEAEVRAAMSDAEFWEHVGGGEPGGTAAYDPEDWTHDSVDHDLARTLSDPCPECGATGACGWDDEGRPLIHATNENEEKD